MTAEDRKVLEALRGEVAQYHADVLVHVTRCEACGSRVESMYKELYGEPGNEEASPGVVGQVADFQRSRKTIRLVLTGVRGMIVALGVAALEIVLGGK